VGVGGGGPQAWRCLRCFGLESSGTACGCQQVLWLRELWHSLWVPAGQKSLKVCAGASRAKVTEGLSVSKGKRSARRHRVQRMLMRMLTMNQPSSAPTNHACTVGAHVVLGQLCTRVCHARVSTCPRRPWAGKRPDSPRTAWVPHPHPPTCCPEATSSPAQPLHAPPASERSTLSSCRLLKPEGTVPRWPVHVWQGAHAP